MPGIDFDRLRREISMEQVLTLLGFEPSQRTGDQWYGGCPLHKSTPGRNRHFSVNVAIRRYHCHKCHSQGNQLELWATSIQKPLHPAMIDLCHALGREIPWIRRWGSARKLPSRPELLPEQRSEEATGTSPPHATEATIHH